MCIWCGVEHIVLQLRGEAFSKIRDNEIQEWRCDAAATFKEKARPSFDERAFVVYFLSNVIQLLQELHQRQVLRQQQELVLLRQQQVLVLLLQQQVPLLLLHEPCRDPHGAA